VTAPFSTITGGGKTSAKARGSRPMPQYFFMVRGRAGEIESGTNGTELPNVAEALFHAERKIRELRNRNEYQRPGPMMIVKDRNQQTVLSVPFYPGF
jgi:hypothetical protein